MDRREPAAWANTQLFNSSAVNTGMRTARLVAVKHLVGDDGPVAHRPQRRHRPTASDRVHRALHRSWPAYDRHHPARHGLRPHEIVGAATRRGAAADLALGDEVVRGKPRHERLGGGSRRWSAGSHAVAREGLRDAEPVGAVEGAAHVHDQRVRAALLGAALGALQGQGDGARHGVVPQELGLHHLGLHCFHVLPFETDERTFSVPGVRVDVRSDRRDEFLNVRRGGRRQRQRRKNALHGFPLAPVPQQPLQRAGALPRHEGHVAPRGVGCDHPHAVLPAELDQGAVVPGVVGPRPRVLGHILLSYGALQDVLVQNALHVGFEHLERQHQAAAAGSAGGQTALQHLQLQPVRHDVVVHLP
mmetsp:Transcript_61864/g.166896  ORF Transcript_61864/g.166896 Transcript_61864/m.166896 type:complete len:360 (-) Transcript_61864:181-1260(-)